MPEWSQAAGQRLARLDVVGAPDPRRARRSSLARTAASAALRATRRPSRTRASHKPWSGHCVVREGAPPRALSMRWGADRRSSTAPDCSSPRRLARPLRWSPQPIGTSRHPRSPERARNRPKPTASERSRATGNSSFRGSAGRRRGSSRAKVNLRGDPGRVDLRHEHVPRGVPELAPTLAHMITHRRLRNLRAMLVDEPPPDPLGRVALLAGRLEVGDQPLVDQLAIRAELRRRPRHRRALGRRQRRLQRRPDRAAMHPVALGQRPQRQPPPARDHDGSARTVPLWIPLPADLRHALERARSVSRRSDEVGPVQAVAVGPDRPSFPADAETWLDIAQTYRGLSRAHVAWGMRTGARDRWAPGPAPVFMAASAARRR